MHAVFGSANPCKLIGLCKEPLARCKAFNSRQDDRSGHPTSETTMQITRTKIMLRVCASGSVSMSHHSKRLAAKAILLMQLFLPEIPLSKNKSEHC